MEILTGRVIKSYEILEQIGKGGFGAVYRAYQPGIGRDVAIKVILPQHANHPDFVRRFETEAQVIARLEHPHIVPLYDYWREPNTAYLVMRYLRGGNLRQSLEDDGAWSLLRTANMIAQIGSALALAHREGIVHRDLKSDNILLDENGNCYLSDFGIAKDLDQNTNITRDAILGTPAYLSPEQIRGEVATAQSDIYALGILAYETLTASKPYFDMTPATVLFKQLNEPLPDVRGLRPDLPEAVSDILYRATAKDPQARYTDVIALARDLQTVAQEYAAPHATLPGTSSSISITDLEENLIQAVNPYKGLRAFQVADAADFYGRKALVERLLARLHEDTPFLAVVGPSGSGKSSVVKAGLMPRLQNGTLDSTTKWYTLEMVPGTHPMEELELALNSIATREMPDLLNQLKAETRGMVRAIRRVLPDEDSQLVLLIDQFEEVFTLVEQEADRLHFLNSLLEAVNDSRSRVKVIITLRADFYDRPLLYGRFGELMRQRTELVLPLNEEELEEAIVKPARGARVALENGLVAAIIQDVNEQPGALPLLQYALTELFERREGRMMTLKAYEAIGGTSGALTKRAEEIYESFSSPAQEAARQMFLRLVTLGEGAEDTRRRVLQTELMSLSGQNDLMQQVIERFGQYRLLTFDHDPLTRTSTVEVAHEALIRRWNRMRLWLSESRESLRIQRRLASAAEDWLQSGRDRSFLARGSRLQQFQDWAASSNIALNQHESDYLKASLDEREAQQAEERARLAREQQLERESRDRLRLLAVVSAIAALIGFVLAGIAVNQSQVATQVQAQAEERASEASSLALSANARNALAEGDTRLALALALESQKAYQPAPAEVLRTLASAAYAPSARARFDKHDKAIVNVAFNSNGRQAVSVSLDSRVIVYDRASASVTVEITLEDTYGIDATFSPNSKQLAVGCADGSIRLYSLPDGREVGRLLGHSNMVTSLLYTPNGQQLVSASLDKSARLWDVKSGEEIRLYQAPDNGALLRLSLNRGGSLLATASLDESIANDTTDKVDRKVRIWDVATGQLKTTITPSSGFIRALQFSPSENIVTIGVWDSTNGGTVRFYDAATGEEKRRLFAASDNITDIAYSADGKRIVTASWDRRVRVWDVERGIALQTFSGFSDRPLAIDISLDSRALLIGQGNYGNNDILPSNERSSEVTLWLWDLVSGDQIRQYEGFEEWLWAVEASPDGSMVAAASGPLRLPEDNRPIEAVVRVWDRASGAGIALLTGHTNTIDSVRWSPDGQRLLTASWDSTIRLWDVRRSRLLRTYEGHTDQVYMVRWNADGTQFLSASRDKTIRLWDAETGEVIRTYEGHTDAVNSISFSPDGTQFASASTDRTLRLWDLASGETIRIYEGHTAQANEVIFSPDGLSLFSSSWDDSVRQWNVASGAQVRQFVGHTDNTFGLAISRDGQTLFSASSDRSIRMWNVSTGEELHRFQGHTNWIQEIDLFNDDQLMVSAAQDRLAILWRVDLGSEALSAFANQNRVLRRLSAAECLVYRIEDCRDN